MENIYSKIKTNVVLHSVRRISETLQQKGFRQDLIQPSEFLQCSALNMKKGQTFKPHKHIWKRRDRLVIAQESWVVLRGSVKCFFYDLDNTLISEVILNEGDCSFTFQGGHNYQILQNNTVVMEFKTGPYEGQAEDKEFI